MDGEGITQIVGLAESFYPWTGGIIGLAGATGWLIDKPIIARMAIGGGFTGGLLLKAGLDIANYITTGDMDWSNMTGNLGGMAIVLTGMWERMRRHERNKIE